MVTFRGKHAPTSHPPATVSAGDLSTLAGTNVCNVSILSINRCPPPSSSPIVVEESLPVY